MIVSKETDIRIFHDARVGLINYDYINKLFNVHLYLDSNSPTIKGEANLRATSVVSVQLGSSEPWGSGIYVNEATMIDMIKYKRFTLLLNSGDTFIIDAKSFELIVEKNK